MSLQAIFDQGRKDWLDQTGDPHIYRSIKTGRTIQVQATTEVEVEVVDNEGMMVTHPAGYMPSGVVADVTKGDILTNQVTGKKWSIQEQYQDNGTLVSFYLNEEN